jgi:uncharacterized Fe-S center protein
MMADVGIVYSEDLVAIEKASLDLVNKFSENKFNEINKVNKEKQIDAAKMLGLGNAEYELLEA